MSIITRALWTDLPVGVRSQAERCFGASVVGERSQSRGHTPGMASRLSLDDGRGVFCKAIPTEEPMAASYRAEASVGSVLPSDTPAPKMLCCIEEHGWVLVAFDDVEGRHPDLGPHSPDLPAVRQTITDLDNRLTPCPSTSLTTAAQDLRADFSSWHRLAEEPPTDLDVWSVRHLPALVAAENVCLAALDDGNTLLHTDLRADNILVTTDGIVVLDWSWAVRGPAWVDVAFLLPQLILAGHTPTAAEHALAGIPAWEQAPPEGVTGFAAAITGLWESSRRRDAPPALQAYWDRAVVAGRAWTAHRSGWA